MARKFLYLIAGLIVLILAAMIALSVWSEDLSEWAFVPDVPFAPQPAKAPNAWETPAMWIARPGLANDPSRWLPSGVSRPVAQLPVAVFFVHPTSYIEKGAWNGDLDDPTARTRSALFVQGMASPFNAAAELWAPRYRQAAVGAFLTDKPEADAALDLAYRDVLAAFDAFVKHVPSGQPIVLAGHSQGAFLLRRLMRDRVAGKPIARRIAAAYLIGWPVSLTHDLPRMGLPACARADQSGCVASWLSVADPADTTSLMRAYARRRGLDGQPVGTSPFVCTNPLTGRGGEAGAPATLNLGTLVPQLEKAGEGNDTRADQGAGAEMAVGVVPAACGADHFLHIGPPPALDMGPYVLPGNNYHLYDVTLFWANVRADFERRVTAWQAAQAAR
ncbi:hypothetical protein WSK_2476 [Novosphingobium sp. Rr 2-17]|uniref:DUF3089 domain-containing protein n=1 Tax=Novosphingobium sp. Rr 2-17 TaxID=555793 RepID=UPI000269AB62|nr:DUF3089 domain-containing protein [Novosphingobium sp. Rr 2-17]EIZ78933.1 hypothetical protein WSK_2476 [Novosphingobium sp. Rr 2-17]